MLEYMTNVYYNTCIHEYMYTDKLHIGIQEYKNTRIQDYMNTCIVICLNTSIRICIWREYDGSYFRKSKRWCLKDYK